MEKQAIIHITDELVNELITVLIKGGQIKVKIEDRALPEDTQVEGIRYAQDRGCWAVLLSSDEFEPTPLGGLLPIVRSPLLSKQD